MVEFLETFNEERGKDGNLKGEGVEGDEGKQEG